MSSLKIEIDFDVTAFEKGPVAYVERVFAPAVVDPLNVAAQAARLAAIQAIGRL